MDIAKFQEELKKASQVNPDDMKELGLDDDDEMDPELKELEKEAAKTKINTKQKMVKMEDIDQMKLDEEDLNDPELLEELGDFPEDKENDEENPEFEEAKEKFAKIESDIKKCLAGAFECKKKGDKPGGIKYLKQKKALEAEKEKLIKEFPKLTKPVPPKTEEKTETNKIEEAKKENIDKKQDIEIKKEPETKKAEQKKEIKKDEAPSLGDLTKISAEDIEAKIHNFEKMLAVSVMDAELELMNKKAEKAPKELAIIYEDKKDNLTFRRNLTMNNIESGVTTPEKYANSLTISLNYEQKLLESLQKSTVNDEDIKRVEQRISLIKKEISDMSAQAPAPQPEQKPEQKPEVKKLSEKPKLEPMEIQPPKPIKTENEPILTQPKLEKQSSTEDPNNLLSTSDIDENEVLDFTKVNKMQYDTVLQRLKDYKDAYDYFINNGMQKRAESFVKKVNQLRTCLKFIKEGKKIDLLKIVPPLTPETLFDQDIAERVKSFQVLTDKLQLQLSEQKAIAKEYIDKQKKDKSVRGEAEKYVKRAEETAKIIKQVQENQKNQWRPLPLFHIATTSIESEVIQEDINPGELIIEYNPPPEMHDKDDYKMDYIIATKEETCKGSFEAHKKQAILLKFPGSYKHLDRAEAVFTLASSSMLFFSKSHGTLKMKLDKFAKQGKIPMQFIDDAKKYKIDIVLKIRKPTKSKELVTKDTKELIIDHFYEPFQKSLKLTSSPQNPASVVNKPKPLASKEEEKKSQSTVPKPAFPNGQDPPLPTPLPNLPMGIREIDVKDPDDIGNLTCCSYLEKKIGEYKEIIQKMTQAERAIPKQIGEKLAAMSKNKAAIEAQIESGKLSPEMYKMFLNTQLKKDQLLIVYLHKLNQRNKVQIVKERILCIQNELKSFG